MHMHLQSHHAGPRAERRSERVLDGSCGRPRRHTTVAHGARERVRRDREGLCSTKAVSRARVCQEQRALLSDRQMLPHLDCGREPAQEHVEQATHGAVHGFHLYVQGGVILTDSFHGGCSRMRPASLPPASSSLTHTRRMDGFCNQNADQLGSLAGLSFPAVYVGVVDCAPASLPPASSSLTHTRRMDGFCNQNADLLGSLAGLSFPVVYVGVVECASASPYTYSSTHRFPDEHTPIETTPLSATSAELGLGLGLRLGLGSHSSSHDPLLLATLLSHNIPLPRVR